MTFTWVGPAQVPGNGYLMRASAQQPPQRLVERAREDIPQRDVDSGVAAHLRAGVARTDIDIAELARMQFDVAIVLADQVSPALS